MLARWCGGALASALLTLVIAIGAASYSSQQHDAGHANTGLLDFLTYAFGGLSILLFFLGFVFIAIFAIFWFYKLFFDAVAVDCETAICTFWPYERIASVSGMTWRTGGSWIKKLRISYSAQVGDEVFGATQEVPVNSTAFSTQFGQHKVAFASDPKAGEPVVVVFRIRPIPWFFGRGTELTKHAVVAITDHSPELGSPDQVRDAIEQITPLIKEAQSILNDCGFSDDEMRAAGPMHWANHCAPRILKLERLASNTIHRVAPDHLTRFQAVGLVTHNTHEKKAMIQTVEKWQINLLAIQDELRKQI